MLSSSKLAGCWYRAHSSLPLPNTRWGRIQSHILPREEAACAVPSTLALSGSTAVLELARDPYTHTDPHTVSSALPSHTQRTQRALSAKTKRSGSLGAKYPSWLFPFCETIIIIQRRQLVSIPTLKCAQHKVWTDEEESTEGCYVCKADSEQQGSYAPSFTPSLCLTEESSTQILNLFQNP